MRTTVVIDDAILKQAKRAAAESGRTLSDLINEALSAALARRSRPRQDFQMVVYGGDSPVRLEPQDFKDTLEAEDAASIAP